jgi:hypothetical protein
VLASVLQLLPGPVGARGVPPAATGDARCALVVAYVDLVSDGEPGSAQSSFVWNVRTGEKFPIPPTIAHRVRRWFYYRNEPPISHDGERAAFPGYIEALDGTKTLFPWGEVPGFAVESRALEPVFWRDDHRVIAVSVDGGRFYELDYSKFTARRITEEEIGTVPRSLVRTVDSDWYLVKESSLHGRGLSLVNVDSGEFVEIGLPATEVGGDVRASTYVLAGTLVYVASGSKGTRVFHYDVPARVWRLSSTSPVQLYTADTREKYSYVAGSVVFQSLTSQSLVVSYSSKDPVLRPRRLASLKRTKFRLLFRDGLVIYSTSSASYEPLRPSAGRPRVFPKTDPQGRKIREVYGFGRFVNYPEGCGWM